MIRTTRGPGRCAVPHSIPRVSEWQKRRDIRVSALGVASRRGVSPAWPRLSRVLRLAALAGQLRVTATRGERGNNIDLALLPCKVYIGVVTTGTIRRQAALDAIARVLAGEVAEAAESDLVDFKEEVGTVGTGGQRRPIGPRHAPAAEVLAIEVACFANSPSGGVLVVGVDDKSSGPAALHDTYLDLGWLRERLWSLTSPRYSVDEIEEVVEQGRRLYLINVPPAIEEIRAGGKLRMRRGKSCQEVSGDDARRLLEERRGFDWTAQPSGLHLSAANPDAFRVARRFYGERRGEPPSSDRELARRMGVLIDDSQDPELNRAGAILLAPFEPSMNQLQFLIADAEGSPSSIHVLKPAPILLVLEEVFDLLDRVAFPVQSTVVGLTRRELRAVPEPAFREALVNAVMHRDYQLDRLLIVALALGAPVATLKVRSPGGLPASVSADRLLAIGSRPRNEALATALRVLAVAEREGVGINTMYRSMLRDGHPSPEIVEEGGDVVVRLSGGRPDILLRTFFDEIEARNETLGRDVAATIAIRRLLEETPLRPEALAVAAQRTPGEALDTLLALKGIGVVERLLDRSRSFRLTRDARDRLGAKVRYRRASVEEHWALVRAYLDAHSSISREEAATLLEVAPIRATRILGQLVHQDHLAYVGPTRGRSVRYRLV